MSFCTLSKADSVLWAFLYADCKMSVKVTQNRLVFVAYFMANIYHSNVLHAQGRFMVRR